MAFSLAVTLVVVISILGYINANYVVENNLVTFNFEKSSGDIIALLEKKTKLDVVGAASHSVPLVNFQFVDQDGSLTQGKLPTPVFQQVKSTDLKITWPNTPLNRGATAIAHANLTLTINLSQDSTVADWAVSCDVTESTRDVGLWDVTVSLPLTVGSSESGELFFPAGYGYIYDNPIQSTGGAHAKTYPGGETSMQYMALGCSTSPVAAYFAANDRHGSGKLLQYSTRSGKMKSASTRGSASWNKLRVERDSVRDLEWTSVHHDSKKFVTTASAGDGQEAAVPTVAALSMVLFVPNAGEALTHWEAPYSFSVGIVPDVQPSAGRPLWTEAAKLYKTWTMKSADWTQLGPIRDQRRLSQYPSWFLNNNIWLNTHWQCHDIFNATGGEPNFVSMNTESVANRLRQKQSTIKATNAEVEPVLLHWYEWQQGPSPKEEDRYLFDTHYPDYFPARSKFQESVASLAKQNILTFPYINGRISDINSNAYLSENGVEYCTKSAPKALIDHANPPPLTAYVETYGSNATFCVTNPFTPYWQGKLADTCRQLVEEDNVAGVYIDQIGSAVPKLCYDASHNHTLGGGSYWAEGYANMMATINKQVSGVSPSVARPMVTEDNAEPYLTMVQGLLTLNAFKAWYSDESTTPTSAIDKLANMKLRQHTGATPDRKAPLLTQAAASGPHVAPAFPYIYGGYFVGFGAIWTRADFADKDWWCARLSTMFVTGTQLGWFSIAGRNDDNEDSCGPMGVGDLILDPSNDGLMDYFHVITKTRTTFIEYFTHGHVANPPVLSPAPARGTFVSEFDNSSQQYSTVQFHSWQVPDDVSAGSPVIVVFANAAVDGDYEGTMSFDPTNWWTNTPRDASYRIRVFQITPDDVTEDNASLLVAVASEYQLTGASLSASVKVKARSATVMEIVRVV